MVGTGHEGGEDGREHKSKERLLCARHCAKQLRTYLVQGSLQQNPTRVDFAILISQILPHTDLFPTED